MDDPTPARLRTLVEQRDWRGGVELLAKAYGRRLHGFLFRFFGDRRDAEDVAQEVWVAALGALPEFRFEAAPRTWLFRIAMNKVADQRRRGRPMVPLDSVLLSKLEGKIASSVARRQRPDVQASLHRRQKRVSAQLERFSERDREVLLLVTQGGLAAREVAEVLGLTETNVRQIKKTLIDALLEAVERDGS
jgi:RNA polymerase sigma-70 factor (ECF subfamily)